MMRILLMFLVLGLCETAQGAPVSGAKGVYRVLTGTPKVPVPFDSVEIAIGPSEVVGSVKCQWWQMEIKKESASNVVVQVLTDTVPFAAPDGQLICKRYIVSIPESGDVLEYRNVHTGKPVLPGWNNFEVHFVPQRPKGAGEQLGLPNTLQLLGHTLTLHATSKDNVWRKWDNVKVLNLDPELSIASSRNIRDAGGHRISPPDYKFEALTGEDYRMMIDVGFNLFPVAPDQEEYVRSEPVYYLRNPGDGPGFRYPADLYRSNYAGMSMFIDEPTCIISGDKQVHTILHYFSDFASSVKQRVNREYSVRTYDLENALKKNGFNLGNMRLEEYDYPCWETVLETTFYQMEGGGNGLVHEGRYQLKEFQSDMDRWTGVTRTYTDEEYLRYQYALLRGGTRPFGKLWGTSIYGQADPNITPLAVTMAYDMGARYIWFWASDGAHHMPWYEQIDLVKILKAHAKEHPRQSIFDPLPKRDLAITIPYGYFLSLSHGGTNPDATLWWVRELDRAGQNDSSRKYKILMERSHKAVIEAFDKNEDFDITIDDGRSITDYKRIVNISDY